MTAACPVAVDSRWSYRGADWTVRLRSDERTCTVMASTMLAGDPWSLIPPKPKTWPVHAGTGKRGGATRNEWRAMQRARGCCIDCGKTKAPESSRCPRCGGRPLNEERAS